MMILLGEFGVRSKIDQGVYRQILVNLAGVWQAFLAGMRVCLPVESLNSVASLSTNLLR
jgi:hypothetical protein